jgi:hypothetical protein
LQLAALNFEQSIQKRLGSRTNRHSIDFDGDIFRYCFGQKSTCFIQSHQDLDKLPLNNEWNYKIDKNGLQISFPFRVQFRLNVKGNYVVKENIVAEQRIPQEKLVIISATRCKECVKLLSTCVCTVF